LVDGGTSTIDMLGYFIDYSKIIIIDALRSGLAPGTVYKIKPEELKTFHKGNVSIHDVQILDVIKIASMMGANPEVIIYGIEPMEIKYDLELSEPIKAIIPDIIKFIQYELSLK
jgi:hydrogenase maturation protease